MLKQIRQSLITRLMMYFLIAGLLLIILFGINIAHGLRVHFKQEILPNIAQYLNYITLDIGSPPDLIKAERLSDDLSFELAISGPEIDWKSSAKLPSLDNIDLERGPEPYREFRVGHHRGNNFVVLVLGDYEYMYVFGRLFKGPRHQRNAGIIIIILLVLVVLFLLIRSSLKPLKSIGKGVGDIARGDLDKPITPDGSMEFKRLSSGINEMALQIKSMLENKHQLLLAISHELRSPITRAKVNLELLEEQSLKQALIYDMNEMESLINQILESERLNQQHAVLNITLFPFHECVENIILKYFSNADISTDLEELDIMGDEIRLSLLVKNLLDNAIKYSIDGGRPPSITLQKENSNGVIKVEDSGCGIATEELDQITRPFYRVDPARLRSNGGVGLGLYLCQLIVTAHKGTMTFNSEVGKGTIVEVMLPLNT